MNRLLLQPAFIISSVFILALVAGGVYVSVQIRDDEANKDALVKSAKQLATGHASAEQIAAELAQARIDARVELERLNLLTNYPTSAEALAAVRQEVYENVLTDIVGRIDRVIGDLKASQPSSAQLKIQQNIIAEQEHIKQILEEWRQLVSNPSLNSNPTAAAQASQYAAEIKQDIQDLKKLVEQLTPENSGLSPSDISADQSAVDQAIKDANQAVSDLAQTSVPPSVVQQQQNDTSAANQHVADLQHDLQEASSPSGQSSTPSSDDGTGNTDTSVVPDNTSSPNSSDPNYQPPSSPNYPGTRYVPPESAQDPDKPKLIEGANGVQ